MSKLLYTVQDLVDETRAQLDEQNRDTVDTNTDILPALNRAQDYAFDTYGRKYPEPILDKQPLTLTSEQEYDIPEGVFEDRILRIEIVIPGGTSGNATYRRVTRVSYQEAAELESTSPAAIPNFYLVYGRKIRFIAAPTGTYSARIWFLKSPEKLVLPQGRVQILNAASNYVIVDSTGTSLTTESDQLGSYINIVDGQTGLIKKSLQIQSIAEGKITFRSTPTRSTVLNRTISGSFTSADIQADDYLSPIDGTCVPYYGRPTSNFLIQFAVAEIRRKLGDNSAREDQVLERFERQVEKTFTNRENNMTIQRRNPQWKQGFRRWFIS